jgi:hypothetical protein
MELKIGFEGKNGSRIHNWDSTRPKMQEESDKNMFEPLEPSKSL